MRKLIVVMMIVAVLGFGRKLQAQPTIQGGPSIGLNGAACEFSSLSAAITAAVDGDEIYMDYDIASALLANLGDIDKELVLRTATNNCTASNSNNRVQLVSSASSTATDGGMMRILAGKTVTVHDALMLGTRFGGAQFNQGGIVYVASGGSLILHNSDLEAGATTGDGGCVYLNNATLNLLDGSDVRHCLADGRGGGVFATGDSNVTVDASQIGSFTSSLGNEAAGDGGGVFLQASTLVLTNGGEIRSNTAGGSGGGVFAEVGSTVRMDDGGELVQGMLSNTADGDGGGVYLSGSTLRSLGNGSISANSAENGGGVFVAGLSSVELLDNIRFEINNAVANGGAITDEAASRQQAGLTSSITIENGTLVGNQAANGGALFISSSTLTSRNSAYTVNQASGFGGAIHYTSPESGSAVNNTFTENSASLLGGGIYFGSNSGAFEIATDSSCISYALPSRFYCSWFRSNSAARGSAFLTEASAGVVTVRQTAFTDNNFGEIAQSDSATIFVANDRPGQAQPGVSLQNVLITGDAIAAIRVAQTGGLRMQFSTIAGNNGYPLFSDFSNDIVLNNNIIWGNGRGTLIREVSGVTPFLICNTAQAEEPNSEEFNPAALNSDSDPLFVTTARGSYRLGSGSPAIDPCGDNLDFSVDLDGVGRTNADDMGAFEQNGMVPTAAGISEQLTGRSEAWSVIVLLGLLSGVSGIFGMKKS